MTTLSPTTDVLLACYQTHWQTSSDALLIIEFDKQKGYLHYANGIFASELQFSARDNLEHVLPTILANKINVLGLQAVNSGSEVRYVDVQGHEIVLFPFVLKAQSFALCRITHLAAMLAQLTKEPNLCNNASLLPSAIKKLSGQVLVAEDHFDNRQLISRLLQKMGLSVVIAKNGEEAVELAISKDFELILMDIQMPVFSGIKALELLQQTGLSCPVIALSSNASNRDIQHYLSLGFNAHVAKPINVQALVDVVNQHVNNDSAEAVGQVNLSSEEYLSLKRQYISHLPADIDRLQKAYQMKDFRLIGKVAHAIKGSSGNFGFDKLSELAGAIEQAADDVNQTDIDTAMLAFESEYKRYGLF